MRKLTLIVFVTLLAAKGAFGQTRAELEEKRKKNLEDIEYVDKLLKSTSNQKSENLNELRVIGKKLDLREKLINEYGQEINLLEYRISLNRTAGEMLEEDLDNMKKEYAKAIVSAYKASLGTPALAFILSSTDFNQGYKRLKYIQQVARYRRRESETIETIYLELKDTRERLEKDRKNVGDLRSKEQRQKDILKNEKGRKESLVNSLGKKEKQLQQDLQEKRRIAKQIEKEIEKVIEEERNKSTSPTMTEAMKNLGNSFGESRGKLPWPVEQGIITAHFGLQPHPVLKNVTEDNIGIEITSNGKTTARAVYTGEVMRVFAISGANMAIIIRHGKYLTVYQNLINVRIKAGDNVSTGQELGQVYVDGQDGNKAVIKFMVCEEKKMLDPELWLLKK